MTPALPRFVRDALAFYDFPNNTTDPTWVRLSIHMHPYNPPMVSGWGWFAVLGLPAYKPQQFIDIPPA